MLTEGDPHSCCTNFRSHSTPHSPVFTVLEEINIQNSHAPNRTYKLLISLCCKTAHHFKCLYCSPFCPIWKPGSYPYFFSTLLCSISHEVRFMLPPSPAGSAVPIAIASIRAPTVSQQDRLHILFSRCILFSFLARQQAFPKSKFRHHTALLKTPKAKYANCL